MSVVTKRTLENIRHAQDLADIDTSIVLIRRCSTSKDDGVLRMLIVSKNTSVTEVDEDFLVVAFNAGIQENDCRKEICEITQSEYKEVINKTRKLPKGWVLNEVLFDGKIVYEDMDSLIKSIRNWSYSVMIDDDPMTKMLGFSCASGRKWQISHGDYKKTKMSLVPSFDTNENKILFLNFLNTKLFFQA